jgi:pyruvate/2-oxoglutarate dehydrogenase complex dihydrolipoamide acyltransferase (E2) component
MTKLVPRSANRDAIYDLLTRAKRYHATLTNTLDLDVGPLYAALERARAAGRVVGFIPSLVKATSLLMVKYPRLNHHLFHGLFRRYEVDFEEVSANLVLMRKGEGDEKILLPLVLRHSDRMTVDEITTTIVHHMTAPLESLEQFAAIQRVKKLPRLALRWFSYKCRSDHRHYLKYFGTYGFSPLLHEDVRGVAESNLGVSGHSIANTASVFFPFSVRDKPIAVAGRVELQKTLAIIIGIDHFVVDGYDAVLAGLYLQKLLAEPALLGL